MKGLKRPSLALHGGVGLGETHQASYNAAAGGPPPAKPPREARAS